MKGLKFAKLREKDNAEARRPLRFAESVEANRDPGWAGPDARSGLVSFCEERVYIPAVFVREANKGVRAYVKWRSAYPTENKEVKKCKADGGQLVRLEEPFPPPTPVFA